SSGEGLKMKECREGNHQAVGFFRGKPGTAPTELEVKPEGPEAELEQGIVLPGRLLPGDGPVQAQEAEGAPVHSRPKPGAAGITPAGCHGFFQAAAYSQAA